MSKERELLQKVLTKLNSYYYEGNVTIKNEIIELLAQPEEGVYQKLLRIEDGIEIEILPSEVWLDGYEAGKRSALLSKQPEQEPEAWMWTRNYEGGGYTNKVFEFLNDAEEYAKDSQSLKRPDIIRPLYTSPKKREPLGKEIKVPCGTTEYMFGFKDGVLYAEKEHGI